MRIKILLVLSVIHLPKLPLELFKKLLMVDYENRSSIENYIVQEVEAAVNKYDPFYPQNRNRLKASEIDDFNVLKKRKLAENPN